MRKRQMSVAVIIGLLIIAPILISSTLDNGSYADENFHQSQDRQIFTAPKVPSKAIFAGQEIDLKRSDLRERMDRELMSFNYMHSTSMLLIKRANRFFPIIEPLLKKNNLPDDLKYLMVIESSIDPFAMSPAGAAGLWQIMRATGRELGLEVNENIDERYHVEKATVAACKYLKRAYNKYGNWLTAAASYNAGQGRISGELEKQGVKEATDLWLVPETSRYMFRLLAVKQFMENPRSFGFYLEKEQLYPVVKYKEVTVGHAIADLASFAKQHGISYAQLKEANPWLKQRSLINKTARTYKILIPMKESLNYNPSVTVVHYAKWIS